MSLAGRADHRQDSGPRTGETNARFPPYTVRERNPEGYCLNASTVEWKWIHPDMRTRLQELQDIIDDYISVSDPFAPY
jgi:hypothetical protein